MRAAILGGGVMGEAILGAALARGVFDAASTIVAEILPARREFLAATHGVAVTASAQEATADADLVLVSVKPQEAKKVAGMVPPGAVVVSIMAGITIASIRADFQHERVVRVMPNTPVAVREGMSVWTATPEVTAEQRSATRTLLASFGQELYVDDEAKIDMATAMNGSGPAYVFLFIEAMIEGGVSIGLTRAQAEQLSVQTVFGSSLYLRESGRSAADLRAAVTSPAGTTAAGLLEMERRALRATVIDGIRAAYDRARELGRNG